MTGRTEHYKAPESEWARILRTRFPSVSESDRGICAELFKALSLINDRIGNMRKFDANCNVEAMRLYTAGGSSYDFMPVSNVSGYHEPMYLLKRMKLQLDAAQFSTVREGLSSLGVASLVLDSSDFANRVFLVDKGRLKNLVEDVRMVIKETTARLHEQSELKIPIQGIVWSFRPGYQTSMTEETCFMVFNAEAQAVAMYVGSELFGRIEQKGTKNPLYISIKESI